MTSPPSILSFGGGVNSAAMMVGMHERGLRPDAILFADTKGEKPHTYDFVQVMDRWCAQVGFPGIVVVANDGMYPSLEENCLRKKMLPSKAYGGSSCSDKYKIRPQNKWTKKWQPAVDCWAAGGKVTKLIGIDAGEAHRAAQPKDDRYDYRYPLIEWEWGRAECLEALARAGLPNPGKSACFFCPSSKKWEIRQLAKLYPELAERAIAMERNAELDVVAGLGRHWSWESYLRADEAQGRLFPDIVETPCVCWDGDRDED